MSLDVLQEPRTFPPKMFFLIVWVLTFIFGLFGMIVVLAWSVAFWIWAVVMAVALRQIWVTRWVQVDAEGIRVRNLAQRGRELRWSDVTDIDEREIPLRKEKFFVLLKLTGESKERPGKSTTIALDSDIESFDTLRELIQSATGKELIAVDEASVV